MEPFSSSIPLCWWQGDFTVGCCLGSQLAQLTWSLLFILFYVFFPLDEEDVGKMEPRKYCSENVKCLLLQILAPGTFKSSGSPCRWLSQSPSDHIYTDFMAIALLKIYSLIFRGFLRNVRCAYTAFHDTPFVFPHFCRSPLHSLRSGRADFNSGDVQVAVMFCSSFVLAWISHVLVVELPFGALLQAFHQSELFWLAL